MSQNNLETTLFIYYKDKEIKALGLTDAKENHQELIAEGWEHTATINASVWIEYLFNKCEAVDVMDEILSLSKEKH